MKYLLDTHIWIWTVSDPKKLSTQVKEILLDQRNQLFISSISIWEFMVLLEKKRIAISKSVDEWLLNALERSRIREIPVDGAIAIRSRRLLLPHEDPADRFIAATASIHRLALITSDGKLSKSQEIEIVFN